MESTNNVNNEKIQKTASTLFDLNEHSDIRFGDEIAKLMVQKTGIEWPRISVNDFSAFPVARFHSNQFLLEFFAQKYGERLQIIEIGSGFTPHFYNLEKEVGKYIEVDLEINSGLKKEIATEIESNKNHIFIAGDILEEKTWEDIKKNINLNDPVVIFSEGVISQYFNDEQKEKIANLVMPIIVAEGSCFILDDTLRNHPELHHHPIIMEGMSKIVAKSGSNIYNNDFQTFPEEVEKWSKFLPNTKIVPVEYVLSKPEMDFAIDQFKLIVCVKNLDEKIVSELEKVSKNNKLLRIWK